MQIGNLNIDGILFLAPLAGISKRPFRLLAREYGASVCYTEMISADAMKYDQHRTIKMLDHTPDEHPVGIQLFGSCPENMAQAVKKIQDYKPDIIDINMGCPVRKVIRKNGGAALLKNIGLATEILQAAVENTKIPVTVKIRSGWSPEEEVYLELGKNAEKAGIAAITLHPRFRTQGFSGKADWEKIRLLKQELGIPVIGNGDVITPQDARDMLDSTGCDAIMIGRAAMKDPFVFKKIKAFLDNGQLLEDLSIKDKIELALEHSRMTIAQYREKSGATMMRKHLAWYTKGFPGGAQLRNRLMNVESFEHISDCLSEYLNSRYVDAGS
jgi:tRNA-dihydrouridine synthase B